MSLRRESLLSILFVLMFINGSTALGILDAIPGSQFLNGLPFVSNNDNDGAATEQWPSFVRIVDVADLPSLLFPNINASSPHSPGSIWSNFFNIFTQGSEGTINDEMERENGAWFAIPGWNKAVINGTGLSHNILPGLLVPAKLEPHQMNDIANRLNNFSQIFPLGFLFNHGQDLNPFNLPFLPGKIVNPSKSEPEKIQPSLETADIKPVSENMEIEIKTPNPKEARKVRTVRSLWARFLNLENDENAEAKDGDKVVNVIEPVKETGIQMEPIPTTESQPTFNAEAPKTNSEDTRTLGALSLISPLLNLLSGNLGGSSSKTLTNDLQNLGTLRPPSPYNGQSGFNNQNGFTGHIDQIGQPQFFGI